MSFATVGYAAADFYNLSLDGVNLLSSIFMFITCPVTCFALYFVKRHHLLTSLLMSAVICFLGSIMRVFRFVNDSRMLGANYDVFQRVVSRSSGKSRDVVHGSKYYGAINAFLSCHSSEDSCYFLPS